MTSNTVVGEQLCLLIIGGTQQLTTLEWEPDPSGFKLLSCGMIPVLVQSVYNSTVGLKLFLVLSDPTDSHGSWLDLVLWSC